MVTYADRPWIKNYDAGVPETLHPYPEATISGLLQQTARKHPDHTALITDATLPVLGHSSHRLSYRQLDETSDAMAAALVDMGLQKGDRVAIVMPNISSFVIAYYGVLKAGGVAVATNPIYPAKKMQYQINDCDAEIVITVTLFYKMIKEIQPGTKTKHVIVANVKDHLPGLAKFLFSKTMEKKAGHYIEQVEAGDYEMPDLLKRYAGRKSDVDVTPDDIALIQYTGGTTGVSKGALATHRAIVASTMQIMSWTGVDIPGVPQRPRHEMITLAALPMFHVYGLIVLLSQSIASGCTIILVPNPRDIKGLLGVISHYRPNFFAGVPTLYNAMINHPDVKSGGMKFDSIYISQSGAAPMHHSTKEGFEAAGGRCLFEGYGMSEIPCGNHSNPLVGENRDGAIGLPLPDVECAIVDLEDGKIEMPVGEIGEIVIHAPHMMTGYHKMPEETADMLREREDGRLWAYTGDIGLMDEEGYFYLVDRKKDVVLIGGFNVYPAQVEKVLQTHSAIFEVSVAGIPNPKRIGDESLKAWVVLHPEQSVERDELITFCKDQLVNYEIPRHYEFVDEIPKTAVGKNLRRELVQREEGNEDIVESEV
jgi:long-chain acyl-CoA synthetase